MLRIKSKAVSCFVGVCMLFGSTVFASVPISEDFLCADESEVKEICSNLDTRLVDGAYGETHYIDGGGDEQITEKQDIDYSNQKILKRYNMDLRYTDRLPDRSSLGECLTGAYYYWMPIEGRNGLIGLAGISKGKPFEEAKESILNNEKFSESLKEELLKTAKEREGKWYVGSISKFGTPSHFLDWDIIKADLETAGITEVEDMKYVYAAPFTRHAVYIKTDADEFLMPLEIPLDFAGRIKKGSVYTWEEVRSAVMSLDDETILAAEEEEEIILPTATPKPTATSKPTATPKPTVTPKPTATPEPEGGASGEQKIFLYPYFTNISFKKPLSDVTDSSTTKEPYVLDFDEKGFRVEFKINDESDKNDIIFVSVYDKDDGKYITSNKGAAVSAQNCVFTGLTPTHQYIVKACALFSEKNVDAMVMHSIHESDYEQSAKVNVLPKRAEVISYTPETVTADLKNWGIIKGYEDGAIRPENKITRAEVCAIINRTVHQGVSSIDVTDREYGFDDVGRETWFYDDVMKLTDFGFINGYDKTVFMPDNDITYNEYIKIITNMLFCTPYAETNGGYPNGYIAAAEEMGLINNIEFIGDDKITRKDAMTILYNAINTPILLVKRFDTQGGNEYEPSNIKYADFFGDK